MARIGYAALDHQANGALIARIEKERGWVGHLYRMLLHSPPIVEGWLGYLTAVRYMARLDGAIRELSIMQIGLLNGAAYEAQAHRPIAIEEGLTAAQLDSLPDWRRGGLFEGRQASALAYTDAMTRDVQVGDDVFIALQRDFSEEEIVELTATIGAYNMVSRFIVALEIDHTDDM